MSTTLSRRRHDGRRTSRDDGEARAGSICRRRRPFVGRRGPLGARGGRRRNRRGCRSRRGRTRRRRWSRRRRGSRHRSGDRCRGWRGCGRGRRRRLNWSRARRQKAERIDVGPRFAHSDSEMDVRRVVLGFAGRPRVCDRLPLAHPVTLVNEQRAEVRERRPVPVRRRDGHREAIGWNGTGEGHLAGGWGPHAPAADDRDVDSPMLARGVWIVSQGIAAENLSIRRPGPGESGWRERQSPRRDRRECDGELCCRMSQHARQATR